MYVECEGGKRAASINVWSESYMKSVETLMTSEESYAAPQYVAVWGMGEVGKLFFEHCLGVQRYMAIFKDPSSFGAQWGKLLTLWPYIGP